jgi:cyclohexyl-isocyanide hydratase
MTTTRIGLLLFPRLTQLDLTGPFEVFSKWPDATVHLLWKSQEPVAAETDMRILSETTLADCKQLDVLCVPGGPGVSAMTEDAEVLAFLREQARGVRFLTRASILR